jgi:pyruvate formate lyase activating enzyme
MTICAVCPHHCHLEAGQFGACRGRQNVNGIIKPINYGMLTSLALDPIEKKPLQRFYPGSKILSIGSFGCNLHCPFCQNFEISMADSTTYRLKYFAPEDLVEKAVALKDQGNIGLAFTYNEPLISYEYIVDTGKLIHKAGLKNVVVTNGCATKEVAVKLKGIVDAYNIDLKGFTDAYYKKLHGDLATVKEFITAVLPDSHVELTTLVVPHENDSEEEMEQLSSWVAELSPEIPLHVSRFFPRFEMVDRDATSVRKVYRLAEIAKKHLHYVYTGNC